jgi:hypothetical protein
VGVDPFAPALEEFVVLDNVRRRRTFREENDEEQGRWATLLRRTNNAVPPDCDVDFSDDEEEPPEDGPEQIEGNSDPRSRMRLLLSSYPELQDDISARLSGLELEEFKKTAVDICSEDEAWNQFCRLQDRDWCFPCAHRASYEQRDYTAGYNQIMAYLTDPKLMEFNFERVERICQDIYFTRVRKYMPKRRRCAITGREKPPRYWWRCMIRRHITDHIFLPIQARMRNLRQYELISYSIKTRMVTRLDRGEERYSVDSKMLSDSIKTDTMVMKLQDSIMEAMQSANARNR